MRDCLKENFSNQEDFSLEKYERIAESAWGRIIKYAKSDDYLVIESSKSRNFIDKYRNILQENRIKDINRIYTFTKRQQYKKAWFDLSEKIRPWDKNKPADLVDIVSDHRILDYFARPEIALAKLNNPDLNYQQFLSYFEEPDVVHLKLRSQVRQYDEIVSLFSVDDIDNDCEKMCVGNHYFEHLNDDGVCYFVEAVKNRYDNGGIEKQIQSCLHFCPNFKTRLVHKFLPEDYFIIEARKKRAG